MDVSPPTASARPASAGVSPRRRALVTTGALMLLGIMPGMGIPGGLMLGIADRVIIAWRGSTALRAIGETAWPLSLIVTVLLPLPLLPALSWVGRWSRAGVGVRLLAVLGVLFAWGLLLALGGLLVASAR
jgi:hypothetical protein